MIDWFGDWESFEDGDNQQLGFAPADCKKRAWRAYYSEIGNDDRPSFACRMADFERRYKAIIKRIDKLMERIENETADM